METIKYITITFFLFLAGFNTIAQSWQQYYQGISFILPNDNPNITNTNSYEYVARDIINLKPDFHFKSGEANAGTGQASGSAGSGISTMFVARIDESLIYTTDYLPSQIDINNHDASLTVGTINGSGSVSPTGGATYNIPIELPHGVNNLVPQLSIVYNSQSNNGLLGWGWHLAGISTITRVSNTIYHDGFTKGINFDADSRFAIDGNRIVIADDGKFHTEIESFSEITYDSSNPYMSKWVINTKNGLTYEYNYRVKANMKTLQWMVSKIMDACGNYISFNYSPEGIPADDNDIYEEAKLLSIEYGGNNGSSPCNKISFFYDERTDKNVYYIKGFGVIQKFLLRKIKITSENVLFRKYEFKYYKTSSDLYSKLVEIKMNGSNGAFLNSTKIKWGTMFDSDINNTTLLCYPSTNYTMLSGDFFGTSKLDILAINKNSGNWWLQQIDNGYTTNGAFASNQETYNNIEINQFNDNYHRVSNLGDLNGNGKDDIVIEVSRDNNTYYDIKIYFGSIDGLSLKQTLTFNEKKNFSTGDFNGDGITDLIIFPYESTSNSLIEVFSYDIESSQFIQKSQFNENYKTLITMDFNGNHISDIFIYKQTNRYKVVEFDKNWAWTEIRSETNWQSSIIQELYTADFNGDGKTDILVKTPIWYVCLSKGNNFEWRAASQITSKEIIIADFNNDGKSDILNFDYNQHENKYYYENFKILFGQGDFLTNTMTINFLSESLNHSIEVAFPGYALGDINCDGIIDLLFNAQWNGPSKYLTIHPFDKSLFVSTIKNGMNIELIYDYTTLTDVNTSTKCYTKETEEFFPFKVASIPLYVVNSLRSSNGIGSLNEIKYKYKDLVIHSQGKGIMGFKEIYADGNNGKVKNEYQLQKNSDFCNMALFKTTNDYNSNDIINTTSFLSFSTSYLGNRCFFQYADNVHNDDITYGLTKKKYLFDNFGNIMREEILYTDNNSIVTTYNDYVSAGSWCPSKPKIIEVKKIIDGDEYSTLENNIWNSQGLLTSKTASDVNTSYQYDNFGNITSITTSGAGKNITESFQYDGRGRFIVKKTDALNRDTKINYDMFGQVTEISDMNNLVTLISYDGFGNMKQKKLPDGNIINYQIAWKDGGPEYFTIESSGNKPYIKKYYDQLGRHIGSETQGFHGAQILNEVKFNSRGEIVSKTNPDYTSSGETSIYSYDNYGRLASITSPTINNSYSYSNRTVYTTSTVGNSSKTVNCLGMVKKTTDNGGELTYRYFGHGGIKSVDYANQNYSVSMTYDNNGFQKTLTDPNAKTINYSFNELGELFLQVDAKQNTTDMQYDLAGRCTTKTISGPSGNITYNYIYDTEFQGLISRVAATNGTEVSFQYNSFGDLIKKTEKIESNIFISEYEYNNNHDIIKKTYPSGFSILFKYDNFGYLEQIEKLNGNIIWKANSYNAMMQLKQFENNNNNFATTNVYYHNMLTQTTTSTNENNIINDFEYDYNFGNGNMNYRKDNVTTLHEDFSYDNLHRLKDAQETNNGNCINMEYYTNGNIYKKNDAGEFAYEGTQPHAVSKINNNTSNISSFDQDISYNYLNKVFQIDENNKSLEFLYGVNNQRCKVVYKIDGILKSTKYYAEDYEKVINATTNTTRELNYITGPDGLIAIYVKNSTGNTDSLYYIFKDHLGSLTTIADENGNSLQHIKYDVWGKRQILSGNTSFIFDRGYTGHEHLDQFGLINMNGRVYDPIIGRFLSPDNFVQGENSQGLNRYSYCLNNPLKYTDPSGEFIWFVIGGAIIGSYIGSAIASNVDGGGKWNPANWGGTNWWKGAIIGGIIGAGAGAGAAYALGFAGAGTGLSWSVTSNALIMGNMNMAFMSASGGSRDDVYLTGLHGLATGAALGGLSKWSPKSIGSFLAKRNIAGNLDWLVSGGENDDFRLSAGIVSWNVNKSFRGKGVNAFSTIASPKGLTWYERFNMLYETAGIISRLENKYISPSILTNPWSGNKWEEGGRTFDFTQEKMIANYVYQNSVMDYFFNENKIINSYLVPNKANYPMMNMFKDGINSWKESIKSLF